MQHIDPLTLSSLPPRINYTKSFLDFTKSDALALQASKPLLVPLLSTIVDKVYVKLLTFDITAKSFVPRQSGYEGSEVPKGVGELTMEHPMIRFRKDFLKGYLAKLVSMDYEGEECWQYLDKVAVMHTGAPAFKHRAKKPALRVEYIHMGLLLGYVVDILLDAIVEHPDLDLETKSNFLRAFNKIIWIQNDLFARQYIIDKETPSLPSSTATKTRGISTTLSDQNFSMGLAVGMVISGIVILVVRSGWFW